MIDFDPKLNRIVCAAILYENGTLIVSPRHFDTVAKNTIELLNPDWNYWRKMKHEQGFVDKFGEFHSRKSAWEIAYAANQIIRHCAGDAGTLFSENLY